MSLCGCDQIYATKQMSWFLRSLTQIEHNPKAEVPLINDVISFHLAIVRMNTLCRNYFFDSDVAEFTTDHSEYLIFQIYRADKGLTMVELINILKKLSELLLLIGEIFEPGQTAISPDVVLLDSGSDASIGVKAKVEQVKFVLGLFRDSLFFWTTFKHYMHKKQLDSAMHTFSVLDRLNENKALTDEDKRKYAILFKRDLDALLDLKVIPKQILDTELTADQRQLLLSNSNIKLLSEPTTEAGS